MPHDSSESADNRLPIRRRVLGLHQDFKAACLEFVGTVFFLLIGLGGIQVAHSEGSGLGATAYVSACMGLSLLTSAWLFYRITGGLFNPDISLALFLIGVIGPIRFVMYVVAQMLGGIVAAALLLALTPGPLLVK